MRDVDHLAEAHSLMRSLGIPEPANLLYLSLLRAPAIAERSVGEVAGLSAAAAEQAITYLKLFRLISQDVDHNEVVLFASNPRNAWKAHDAEFYWMRSLHIGDIEALPPLPSLSDEKRRRLYLRLEQVCGPVYDRNVRAHDPLQHQHRDIQTGELFASWLAAALGSASRSIVAVDMPPRLPDLAPIWVALTRRIRNGVTYTRVVTTGEIAEHGIDIVSRDINEYGIDLRLAPSGFIDRAFYVIDGKRLLVKNVKGLAREGRGQHYGVYTSKRAIVRRYSQEFESHYLPASQPAAPIVDEMEQRGEATIRSLAAAGRNQEADLFERALRFGKFARVTEGEAAQRLISEGLLVRNAWGYIVAVVPAEVVAGAG